MNSWQFLWPWMFVLLPIPWWVLTRQRSLHRDTPAVFIPWFARCSQPTNQPTGHSSRLSRMLFGLAWVCLVVAMARPQLVDDAVTLPHTGRDMIIAVDLSESMSVTDMTLNGSPINRLDMVKTLFAEFIEGRQGDRIGLIVFADAAYLHAPLSYDVVTVAYFLKHTQLGIIGDATSITDAIGLAAKQFTLTSQQQRVVLLITDGRNTAGSITPQQAMNVAVHHQLTIHTVGIGIVDPSPQGRVTQSLDDSFLRDLSTTTGGRFFAASDSDALTNISKEIDTLHPTQLNQQSYNPTREVFYLSLLVALVLLASAVAIQWRHHTRQPKLELA